MEPFDTFMAHTYSQADCVRRFELIREFLEFSFFGNESVPVELSGRLEKFFLSRNVAMEDRTALLSYGDNFFSGFTRENLYSVLQELQKKTDMLPVVTLTLPVSVGIADTERLGTWFRNNVDSAAIVRMRIDPAVVGGCGVGWKGSYYQLAPDFFSPKNQAEIVSLIASYVGQ